MVYSRIGSRARWFVCAADYDDQAQKVPILSCLRAGAEDRAARRFFAAPQGARRCYRARRISLVASDYTATCEDHE